MSKYANHVKTEGELPSFTYPGGYPIVYFVDNDAAVCASCATAEPEGVQSSQCHMEGAAIDCSVCGEAIESAYGDPEEEREEAEPEEEQQQTTELPALYALGKAQALLDRMDTESKEMLYELLQGRLHDMLIDLMIKEDSGEN